MATIDARLTELDITLPTPMATGSLPFELVRIHNGIAYVSGHVPTDMTGAMTTVLGKVGAERTLADGQAAARSCALGILASLKAELGDLDHIAAWLKLFGMVNAAPDFKPIPAVINGASELILEVFGPEVGAHTRSAVGMAQLPFSVPVEVEAMVALR